MATTTIADQTSTGADPTAELNLPSDEAAVLAQIKQWYRDADRASSDWREDAREDYAFVAGDQWSQEDQAKLKEQLRPCVSINRIQPTIDAVAGMEVSNRQEVQYLPRTEGDAGVNEVLTGAARWMRDQCDAEDEESDAFVDTVICGEGNTETRLDYEADPDGRPQISRVDPLEMWWDPSARKRNRDDARYVMRIRQVALSEAQAMFPDADESDLDATWAKPDRTGDDGQPHDATEAPYYENDQGDKVRTESQKVTLVECQWWEREAVYRVADPASNEPPKSMSGSDFAKLKQRLALLPPGMQMPVTATRQQKRVYRRAFVGRRILAPIDTACEISFTYRCITGKRDRNNGTWYGLVRAMKDPQRWANKFFSTLLHQITTSGKGIMAESDAFDNVRKAEEEWARSDNITLLRPGGLKKIAPKTPAAFPPQVNAMLEFAVSSIRDATGVNVEMLGLADRQQAGVLEAQRTKAGMTILATLFDSLRRYRKEQGRVMLWFIENFLSDGRLVRIVGDEGARYVPLVRQPGTITYDVIVDDSPTSPNQKEATWAILAQLMPTLLSGKIPVTPDMWGAIIEQSPLPASFAEKMKGLIQQASQQQQQNPPPDPAMVKAQAEMQVNQAKLQNQQQLDQAQMQLDAQKQQHEQQLAAGKASFDAQLKQMTFDFEKQLATAKLQMEAEAQQLRMAHEQSLSEQRFQQESSMAQRKAQQEQNLSGVPDVLGAAQVLQERLQAMHEQHAADIAKLHEMVSKPKAVKVQRNKAGKIVGATVH